MVPHSSERIVRVNEVLEKCWEFNIDTRQIFGDFRRANSATIWHPCKIGLPNKSDNGVNNIISQNE